MIVSPGSTNVSVKIRAMTSSNVLTGKVAADFTFWYHRDGGLKIDIIPLSDLVALDDAHVDGGVKEIDNGWYRVDVPDAAFAGGVDEVLIGGSVDGGIVISNTVAIYEAQPIITASSITLQAVDSAGNITFQRGDTFSIQITDLGDLSARSKLWFTIKEKYTDEDAEAILQITLDGLQIFNGADASTDAVEGSITIDDEVNGDITIALSAEYTSQLEACDTASYDIQILTTGGTVTTLTQGKVTVNRDITKSIGTEVV